jgi:branched-chain amino acid transport system permease protein
MELFLQQIANGLVTGSTYAVVGLGFALIFTVLRVVNFAFPDILMVGMFAGILTAVPGPWGLPAAMAGAMAASAAAGYIVNRTVLAPLRTRDILMGVIGTIGVSTIIQNAMALIVGPDTVAYPDVLPRGSMDFGLIRLTNGQVFNFVVCFAMLIFVSLYVRMTKFGRATRAIAERPEVAAAFGVNVDWVCQVTMLIASTMGGVAAVSLGILYGTAWAFIGLLYGLKAFICMLVAGNRYFEGVMAVGLGLGIVEALVTGYLSSNLRDAIAFIILIVALCFRPNGLFGSYET